jgi:hypothetical protein
VPDITPGIVCTKCGGALELKLAMIRMDEDAAGETECRSRRIASEHYKDHALAVTGRSWAAPYGTNTTRPTTLPAFRSANAALARGACDVTL